MQIPGLLLVTQSKLAPYLCLISPLLSKHVYLCHVKQMPRGGYKIFNILTRELLHKLRSRREIEQNVCNDCSEFLRVAVSSGDLLQSQIQSDI